MTGLPVRQTGHGWNTDVEMWGTDWEQEVAERAEFIVRTVISAVSAASCSKFLFRLRGVFSCAGGSHHLGKKSLLLAGVAT